VTSHYVRSASDAYKKEMLMGPLRRTTRSSGRGVTGDRSDGKSDGVRAMNDRSPMPSSLRITGLPPAQNHHGAGAQQQRG
jgi:hypothetical protein